MKKIIHICIGCNYTPGQSYQENFLVKHDLEQGYEVVVITDEFSFSNGKIVKNKNENRVNLGYKLIRLKYKKFINNFLSSKFKKVDGLLKILESESPDIILFHGCVGLELLTLKKYKKLNSKVKIYIDTHEAYHNSGKNFLSLFFQYRILTKAIVRYIDDCIESYLFTCFESKQFIVDNCGVDRSKLQEFLLGGDIIDNSELQMKREKFRKEQHIDEKKIIYAITGKFDERKKLVEVINYFIKSSYEDEILLIGGKIDYEEKKVFELIKANDRIKFLGWLKYEELFELLCATDVYIQPGSQSATMQVACCLKNMMIIHKNFNYRSIFGEYKYLIEDPNDLKNIFGNLNIDEIRRNIDYCMNVSREKLNYAKLSKAYK